MHGMMPPCVFVRFFEEASVSGRHEIVRAVAFVWCPRKKLKEVQEAGLQNSAPSRRMILFVRDGYPSPKLVHKTRPCWQ